MPNDNRAVGGPCANASFAASIHPILLPAGLRYNFLEPLAGRTQVETNALRLHGLPSALRCGYVEFLVVNDHVQIFYVMPGALVDEHLRQFVTFGLVLRRAVGVLSWATSCNQNLPSAKCFQQRGTVTLLHASFLAGILPTHFAVVVVLLDEFLPRLVRGEDIAFVYVSFRPLVSSLSRLYRLPFNTLRRLVKLGALKPLRALFALKRVHPRVPREDTHKLPRANWHTDGSSGLSTAQGYPRHRIAHCTRRV